MKNGTRLLALALALASLAGCRSAGSAFNPPGGGAGSAGHHVYWDEFANSPYPQIEWAALPLTTGSHVTDMSATTANLLYYSCNMAVDGSGRLWVISFPQSGGEIAAIFTLPLKPSSTPAVVLTLSPVVGDICGAIAFDRSGNFWAADNSDDEVYEYTGPFTASATLTPAVTVHLPSPTVSTPNGLAIDASGNVYVANSGESSGTDAIAVLTAPVSSASTVAYYLNGPSKTGALIFDSSGNLYAASDSSGGSGYGIVRYNAGNLSSGATPNIVDGTGLSAVDAQPYGAEFAIDQSGNLYDADCGDTGAIFVYSSVASSFSSSEAPSVSFQDSTLTSVRCAWGIAVH